MGALGSDAAIEAADVVLMDDKPSKIATAIGIARHTIGIARQNVVFAIGVKVAVLFFASDSTLFFVRFKKDGLLKTHFLVMLTYILGEFLIVEGFILLAAH